MANRICIFRFGSVLLLLWLFGSAAYAQTHVFARGTEGSLMHFDGTQWRSLGGQVVGSPDACSWGPERIDVVVRSPNNHLLQIARVNGQWSGWYDLGGTLTSSPTCVSWGPNRIDIFARGADSTLVHKAWDGEEWSEWESLGGELAEGASPDAASWGVNRLDVFIRGKDNGLWQKAWDGREWTEWHGHGEYLTSDPGAISWGPNRIDIFARARDGQMKQISWTGTRWTRWGHLGTLSQDAGSGSSGPDVVSTGEHRTELYVRGEDSALLRKTWDGSSWGQWVRIGGTLTSDPGVVMVRGARARFRVTLNGFRVNRETYDHALHLDGKHDEVYIMGVAWVIDNRAGIVSRQDLRSPVMGDINRSDWRTTRVRAGSASELGGLKTGDTFPSRQPWNRSREPLRDRLPMLMWEGELVGGETAAIIMPTIWEWDGSGNFAGYWLEQFFAGYGLRGLGGLAERVARNTDGEFGAPVITKAGASPQRSLDVFNTAGDRPIGIGAVLSQRADGSHDFSAVSFTPSVFVLTYTAAQEAVRTSSSDKGPGIFEISYVDDDIVRGFGNYTLYLQIERLP